MIEPFGSDCTIAVDGGAFCGGTVPPGSPITACRRHLAAAYNFCADLLSDGLADHLFNSLIDRRDLHKLVDASVVEARVTAIRAAKRVLDRGNLPAAEGERFWSKVHPDEESGCWL